MLRFLIILGCSSALLPLAALANPTAESKENDFLDLVDGYGHVLVQGNGVDDVNAKLDPRACNFQRLDIGLRRDIVLFNQPR